MRRQKSPYSTAGVDYTKIDPLKKLAQNLAKSTSNTSAVKVIEESRGQSAFVWEEEDSFRAFVVEGLGTKNLVADQLRKITHRTYYDSLAQDTVAMIVNDLIVVGAKPQVINAYFAAGSSSWFEDKQRMKDLVEGWAKACKLAGVVWGGGETPSLNGIINPHTIDLGGAAIGIIKPKGRLTLGEKLEAGDAIILIESSGIHANGLTLARAVAEKLPQGYLTKLPDGSTFGENLLIPTHIYVDFIEDLFKEGVDIHYMVNITGHGFRKLMRANRNLSYTIDQIPPIPQIFDFIQKHSKSSDKDMYGTFNMGAGFAIFIPTDQTEIVQRIGKMHSLKSWKAGYLKEGKRKVVIKPKNIIF